MGARESQWKGEEEAWDCGRDGAMRRDGEEGGAGAPCSLTQAAEEGLALEGWLGPASIN